MAVLPLFPLGTVLMPGALLPLQIFEPRYVDLLRDLLAAQSERAPVFGVVAIRKGYEVGEHGVRALHTVGCSAVLRQASDLGQQRFLVVAQGQTRFQLGPLHEDPETSYATAEVTWLDEPDGDSREISELAGRLRREVAAYRAHVGEDEVDAPEDDREMSYWLPQALDLDLSDRQLVLASDTTETRLRLGRQILKRERTLATSLGALGRPLNGPMSPN